MANKRTAHQNFVHLFIQPSEGSPLSLRLDLRKTSWLIGTLSFVVLSLFWGTLFFFRELETNRKLQAELLEAQLKLKLTQPNEEQTIQPMRQLGYSVKIEADSPSQKATDTTSNVPSPPPKDSWMSLTTTTVAARLGSLSSECQIDNCSVKLELLPSKNGISQGELLMILETEVPRIGSRTVSAQQRKQYIFYPGYFSKEEFNSSELSAYEKRPFKFSKALNASINFKVNKLLRPLALNVYLFDSNKNLIHHERKVIDLEENYGN
jgi:hypothetical protein